MSTEESPREIAILGAGKIGRGVVGLLFSRAGYRLHLYDMYMEGMRKLEAQGYYDVRVTDGHDVDESTRIDDFDIVDSTTDTEVIALLQSVDIAACCVYEGAFKSLARVIAEAVSQRHASGNERDLNILLCVNALGAPQRSSRISRASLPRNTSRISVSMWAFARSWFSPPAFRATQTPTPGR